MGDKNGGTADQVYMLKRGLASTKAKHVDKKLVTHLTPLKYDSTNPLIWLIV
jgi:hypothetical protein